MKHLRLSGGGGDHWVVEVCDDPRGEGRQIGTVTKNKRNQLWTAIDGIGRNHGDRYLDRWGAAKQLALGLGERVE